MPRTDYDRAVDAVLTAEREGHIVLPEPEMKDRDQQISDLAEFFLVALGINDE
jgi:hypothetical protein